VLVRCHRRAVYVRIRRAGDSTASFGYNATDAASGDGKTEFGRVMERLEIGLINGINALTRQAKGRVERTDQTLQDRLVKEMRLRGIWRANPSWRNSCTCGTRGSSWSRAIRGQRIGHGSRLRRF